MSLCMRTPARAGGGEERDLGPVRHPLRSSGGERTGRLSDPPGAPQRRREGGDRSAWQRRRPLWRGSGARGGVRARSAAQRLPHEARKATGGGGRRRGVRKRNRTASLCRAQPLGKQRRPHPLRQLAEPVDRGAAGVGRPAEPEAHAPHILEDRSGAAKVAEVLQVDVQVGRGDRPHPRRRRRIKEEALAVQVLAGILAAHQKSNPRGEVLHTQHRRPGWAPTQHGGRGPAPASGPSGPTPALRRRRGARRRGAR